MGQEASQWDIDFQNGRCTHISGLVVEFYSTQQKEGELNLSIEVKYIPAELRGDMVHVKKLLNEVPNELIRHAGDKVNTALD